MLKYLFTAEYLDGESYLQGINDVSSIDPNRSAYFDVKHDQLKKFTLEGEHKYSVDLTDGHFEVDGVPFRMHEEVELQDFRLIYFRQHTHTFNQAREELGHTIVYRLGWQATKDGKNYQAVMEIA